MRLAWYVLTALHICGVNAILISGILKAQLIPCNKFILFDNMSIFVKIYKQLPDGYMMLICNTV